MQGLAGFLSDDSRYCRFSHAGRPVKNHIGDMPRIHHPPQDGAGTQQVSLSHHVVQAVRTDSIRQWCRHNKSPFAATVLIFLL